MIISKAIELLFYHLHRIDGVADSDTIDAIHLSREALIRIEDVRQHPFHPVYNPLPGESMPERGIKVGMQIAPKKKSIARQYERT